MSEFSYTENLDFSSYKLQVCTNSTWYVLTARVVSRSSFCICTFIVY